MRKPYLWLPLRSGGNALAAIRKGVIDRNRGHMTPQPGRRLEFGNTGKIETRFCRGLAWDAGDGCSGVGIVSEHRPSPLPLPLPLPSPRSLP